MSAEKSLPIETNENPELEKELLPALVFFQAFLRPAVKKGEVTNTTAIYNALDHYREVTEEEIDITQVFEVAAGVLLDANEKSLAGQIPLDFWEIKQTADLVYQAVIEDDRFFYEPGFYPTGSKRRTGEVYRIAVKIIKKLKLDPPTSKFLGQPQ
jgi:hypothetical protein